MQKIIAQIAQEIRVRPNQVETAVALLDGGATVPFIARYRKEVTDGLDDIQLRELEARLSYLRELRDRKQAVIKSIDEQGKLTPALLAAIDAAATKQDVEDIYLPFKPKRRTKGMIAREAGLEPLADKLFADPTLVPADEARAFVRTEKTEAGDDFTTVQAVLDGVRDLLSERWAEDPKLVQDLREWLWAEGLFKSKLMDGKDENNADVAKFRDYFDYDEPIGRVPSHRALAVFRGRALDFLDAKLVLPEPGLVPSKAVAPADTAQTAIKLRAAPVVSLAEGRLALRLGWSHKGRAADDLIRKCVAWTWKVKLSLSTERDLFARLREDAEKVAIKVFADNLRDLLLAAPAGPRVVLGLDPGIRTGVKVAVVDSTGKLVETATVFPHEPRKDWEGSLHTLGKLCAKHGVNLIAIGNGTASRETDKLAADLIKLLAKMAVQAGAPEIKVEKVVVSEAGASVYSASEFASQEMPDVDVSLRGAASIARRLQDPLAELVKIDPKSIGVGQYQHDVNQSELAKTLDAVVEDCVNSVGVDLNTASVPLLSRVSGLSGTVAKAVVRWREANGAFSSSQDLMNDRRAPRNLPGDRADHRQNRQAGGRDHGPRGHAQDAAPRAVCQRTVRCHYCQGHLHRAGKTRPRPAPGLQSGPLQRRRGRHQGPQGRHGARRHGQQRGGLWCLRRPGCAPGRIGACEPAGPQVCERCARGGQDRRHRQGAGGGSRRCAQTHCPDHEDWRGARRGSWRRQGRGQPLPGR
jgi:protein Tex